MTSTMGVAEPGSAFALTATFSLGYDRGGLAAAIVDHERTSWGNSAPTITPDDVKRSR